MKNGMAAVILRDLREGYDALTTKRVYKDAIPHGRATEIIVEGRGKHFDPIVVDAFLRIQDTFEHIAIKFCEVE